jgi:hypothetical protein
VKWFHDLLGPRHSIILSYDHFTDDAAPEFESQIDEVAKFYRLVSLSKLVEELRRDRPFGLAAIALRNARKSVLMRAVPPLVDRQLPFALFLRPDCIGLNRLPPEEEIDLFIRGYPDRLSSEEVLRWREAAWEAPEAAEAIFLEARQRLGPLPLHCADPMAFMGTWGNILDIPRTLVELGLHVPARPEPVLREALTFIRQQTGVQVSIAFHSRTGDEPNGGWSRLGISAVLTSRLGAVERGTAPFQLPQWSLESA